MAIIGSLSSVRAQVPASAGFAVAFAYLQDLLREDSPARAQLRALPVGEVVRREMGEGVFAMEQVYATKARAEGFFESHRKYIDIQVLVEGAEMMEWSDLSLMTPREAYNAERDLLVHADRADASRLHLRADEAAVFYPVDVHMPSLHPAGSPLVVRKTVVKVPVPGGAS